jgi:cytochrome c-type biogenesis protein CcmH
MNASWPRMMSMRERSKALRDGRNMAMLLSGMLLTLLLSLACAAQAQSEQMQLPPTFQNAGEEQRFHALLAELRCVMCQNQSLADSDAQIAKDLRREVLNLMREGRSDDEIRDFLVARYGEFVLYRPRMSASTWLLWFGPLAFVLGGMIVAFRLSRRGARPGRDASAVQEDDSQEW